MSIPHLREWSRRQAPDHRQLNEPVDAINRMATGIGPPRQAMAAVGGRAAAVTSAVAKFKLTQSAALFPDHLVCRTWDDETEGDVDVLVAKPWLLRRTPFDHNVRNNIRYLYFGAVSRNATLVDSNPLKVERQLIIPRYVIGDILRADKHPAGEPGVTWEGVELEWEARYAGRAWARKRVQP